MKLSQNSTKFPKNNQIQSKPKTYTEPPGLFYRSLNRLHTALSPSPPKNNVALNLSNEDTQLLAQWTSVKDQLSERALISTLLPPGALKHLSNSLDELVFSCQKSGSPCGFTKKDITQWFHADFLG